MRFFVLTALALFGIADIASAQVVPPVVHHHGGGFNGRGFVGRAFERSLFAGGFVPGFVPGFGVNGAAFGVGGYGAPIVQQDAFFRQQSFQQFYQQPPIVVQQPPVVIQQPPVVVQQPPVIQQTSSFSQQTTTGGCGAAGASFNAGVVGPGLGANFNGFGADFRRRY